MGFYLQGNDERRKEERQRHLEKSFFLKALEK